MAPGLRFVAFLVLCCSSMLVSARERIQKSIQRDRLLAARRGGSGSTSLFGIQLQDIYGEFNIPVTIGKPGQQLLMVLDTSSNVPVSCNSTACDQVDHECSDDDYDLCKFSYDNDGPELSGTLATDILTLNSTDGSTRSFPIIFGCANENTSRAVSGVIGFGPGSLSFPTQLRSEIDGKFSYCLDYSQDSSPLLFGSSAAIKASDIQTTPLLTDRKYPSLYLVALTAISVGGHTVHINKNMLTQTGPFSIDCQTAFTFLPDPVYNSMVNLFKSQIQLEPADGSGYGLDLCFTYRPNYTFPSLVIHFQDAYLVPPQRNYFIAPDPDNDPSLFCLAILTSNGLGLNVIGTMLQQDFRILYDKRASTLSFAPADCNKI